MNEWKLHSEVNSPCMLPHTSVVHAASARGCCNLGKWKQEPLNHINKELIVVTAFPEQFCFQGRPI